MEYIGFISKDEAFNFCKNVFIKMNFSKEDAEIISDHLVVASLRGVDSHGITRILPYVIGLEKGIANSNPKIKILKETESIALIDGDNALGQIPGIKATNIAIEKAMKTGVGIASVKNIGHVGMLAYYGLKISEKKLFGIICTSGPSRVVPWGGKKRLLGTNPICFSFPFLNGKNIVLDIATSITASFKIKLMAQRGENVPIGLILDKNGKPTTNPKDFINGGALLPFGEYKGYGLAIAIEILSSLLPGAPHTIHILDSPAAQGGLFIEAINIEAFRSYEEYIKDLEEIVNLIKTCPLLNGFNEILLPGELEERIYKKRIKEGIPIHEETWKEFKIVSEKLEIELPKINK